MLQAYKPREIYAKLYDEGYTDSEETARKWRGEVQRRWAAEDAEARPARKDAWRLRMDALYRSLLEKADRAKSEFAAAQYIGEAIKVAKLAIVMDGLHQPIKIEHSGSVEVMAMTPLEREKEIAELLAKREAARKASPSGKVFS